MCRRQYAAANITTNLYVISQPWLYSLAWCSGVHSVTTNAPQLLSTMSSPLFVMVTALLCSGTLRVVYYHWYSCCKTIFPLLFFFFFF